MDEKSIIEITLSSEKKQKLVQEFNEIVYDPLGREHYIQLLRQKIYNVLPETLINTLTNQRSTDSLVSAIVINNAPIDEEIYGSPSFEQTGKLFKSGTLSENIITAFASLVGEPYSIYFEGQELVNNLTPQAQNKFDYTGLGSEVELDFHIENAALQYVAEDDYSPSGLFFLGIRIDETIEPTKTFIADTRKALKLLNPFDLKILYGENFYLNLPYRWREIFSQEAMVKCSVLRGALNKPRVSVAFYSNMMLPINQAAKMALAHFHQAIKETAEVIQITPEKLVYVDNRFTLHARERFTPTYDNQGYPYRWIQRVFVSPSLWAFRNFQTMGGRVFLPHSNQGIDHVFSHIPEVA
ncbi:L-asparagine oxygenase [Legionella sainthelensi]|uniref:L-asparagine oxygenase n=1 Tax=Legionella sainthelensi TaxID=28087 RepID=A0A0W0YFA4_9GAMM|nr:TauD/TfdA family dioxygenase [Legionella sainthelensi]KTD55515.1 L-asparagine oxygenase [Legionella sainthelensi]VEH37471.1 L-asparagine oxygenase [Legionella sainthelensi]